MNAGVEDLNLVYLGVGRGVLGGGGGGGGVVVEGGMLT